MRGGASIVITGRVADACLTVGPAAHALGWKWDDWDRLAGGTVAGHLIECGAQVTGGLWINWDEDQSRAGRLPDRRDRRRRRLPISKPAGTGGAVNIETVSEQLLYEVGDPAAYLTPDVVADFTSVSLHGSRPGCGGGPHAARQAGHGHVQGVDRVPGRLRGQRDARDLRPACRTKSPALRRDGACPARTGGSRAGSFWHRVFWAPATAYRAWSQPPAEPPEVVLRIAVRDPRKAVVERFSKEFAPLVTSGPPGVTGYTTGRPACARSSPTGRRW